MSHSKYRFSSYLFALAACSLMTVSPLWGQGNISLRMNEVAQDNCAELQSVQVTVLDQSRHKLDRQAVVKLQDSVRNNAQWQTTALDSKTFFCTEDFGEYDVEVNAVGYLTQHKHVQVGRTIRTMEVEVLMSKDPMAVDLNGSDESLPPKARKTVNQAVYALKSSKLKEGEKKLDAAYKVAPNSPKVNFLYGYLFMELHQFPKSETYFAKAAQFDPQNGQTLTLLGRVQLQNEHNDAALKTLDRAVLVDPEYWMAHNLLADACLRHKDYEKAKQQAQIAINKGNAVGSVANLVLGEALANLGHNQEAIAVLQRFLVTNPQNPAAPQVQGLITQIKNRKEGEAANLTSGNLTLAASQPTLPESAWGPPGIDDVKPTVATNVACPFQQVIENSGERVKELADNIGKFAAVEDLVHQQLDKTGNPISKETRKFDYVASISESSHGLLGTTENRNTRYGTADLPDHFVTSGFVSLALVFHPSMRDNYQMTCEGLGDWHGQATWIMHFRQRDDKPSRMADYVIGSEHYPMKLKGRAWIAANNFEIVHIESDLATPLPGFPVQHQIVEYGPIHFPKKNVDLWLPQRVDIYLELNRHYYHRVHSFDHYMLFSVDSTDKQSAPKQSKLNLPQPVPARQAEPSDSTTDTPAQGTSARE